MENNTDVIRCLFLLPGVDASLFSNYAEGVVTDSVQAAIEVNASKYVVIGCVDWFVSEDDVYEAARIRDLSRILAHASRRGVDLEFLGGCPSENFRENYLPSGLRGYFFGLRSNLTVGRGLFYTDTKNVSLLSGAIDLTGSARTLIWGPHIALFEGRWSVKIYFDVSEYQSNRPLEFVWGNLKDSSSVIYNFESNGRYEVQIDHVWAELDACELRINLPTSTFQGFLNLENVEIVKIQ